MNVRPVLAAIALSTSLGACDGAPSPAWIDRDGGWPTDGAPSALDECASARDCDDGIECTVDTCAPRRGSLCADTDRCSITLVCHHEASPALCAIGETCDELEGCAPGRVCASVDDCEDDDACTTPVACDRATRVCVFERLDGDGDGHPAVVCGGDDCDDGRAASYPDAREQCNGADDDCDGRSDEGTESACGAGRSCVAGACLCDDSSLASCGGGCVDLRTSDEHCGRCGNECGGGTSCVDGACRCGDARETLCAYCTDLETSESNCGFCGNDCGFREQCVAGACRRCGVLGGPCCASGSGCADAGAWAVCEAGTCQVAECATRPTALPAALLPRCSAATRRCIDGCSDSACVTRCIDADTTPESDGVDCGDCVDHQTVVCIAAHGCDDEWARYRCCWEARCGAGAAPGCGSTQCGTDLSALQSCNRVFSRCFANTGEALACYAR